MIPIKFLLASSSNGVSFFMQDNVPQRNIDNKNCATKFVVTTVCRSDTN